MPNVTDGFSLAEYHVEYIERKVKENKNISGYGKSKVVQEALDLAIEKEQKGKIIRLLPCLVLMSIAFVLFIFSYMFSSLELGFGLMIPVTLLLMGFFILIIGTADLIKVRRGAIQRCT